MKKLLVLAIGAGLFISSAPVLDAGAQSVSESTCSATSINGVTTIEGDCSSPDQTPDRPEIDAPRVPGLGEFPWPEANPFTMVRPAVLDEPIWPDVEALPARFTFRSQWNRPTMPSFEFPEVPAVDAGEEVTSTSSCESTSVNGVTVTEGDCSPFEGLKLPSIFGWGLRLG